MPNPPNSHISLIRVNTNQTKCCVFYQSSDNVEKLEVPIDQTTTVANLISMVIVLVKSAATSLNWSSSECLFQLYACRKSGKKMSDLPSLEQNQAVLQTGIKFFFLKTTAKSVKAGRLSSVSTKSIQSEMKTPETKQKEVKADNRSACFCF